MSLTLVEGAAPLVLVAPHGGRRDPERRPWTSGRMRVNDLHTAELTAELAALTGASALINGAHDRNDVDLNRISEAHARAPWFLERLAALLDATVARHGRATVLVVHGWNVIQPVVDLGLGCAPGADLCAVGPRAAVSPGFAASAVRGLVAACAARGIDATVGARYPARHRENLLQLFTPRYLADERPLVRALAALGARVDAVQLELGIALRWPGAWRARLLAACEASLPVLLAPDARTQPAGDSPVPDGGPAASRRLEFASPSLCGLVALDAHGGARLLLFGPAGDLALFTGERTRPQPDGRVGALAVTPTAGAGVAVRFRGPLLRFPDTTPFLDLELGLARGRLVEAEVALDFVPGHAAQAGGDFGAVAGEVVLDGARSAVAGRAFREEGSAPAPWPRVRAALDLGDGRALALTVGVADGTASGFLCRDGAHVAVVAARAAPGGDAIGFEVELACGERLRVTAFPVHRLPVVRAHESGAVRLEYTACRLAPEGPPAGWCEVAGL